MAKLPWFKMYYEARMDKKLITLSDQEHRVWFSLLCFSAEQNPRGIIPPIREYQLAVEVAGGDLSILQTTLQKLVNLNILAIQEDGIAFVHFNERNYGYPSDIPTAVTKRVQKHRALKRDVTSSNELVTSGNAREVEVEVEVDQEVEVKRSLARKAPKAHSSELDAVLSFWREQGLGKVSMRCETRLKALLAATTEELLKEGISTAAEKGIGNPMAWLEVTVPAWKRERAYDGQHPNNPRGTTTHRSHAGTLEEWQEWQRQHPEIGVQP